MGFLLRRLRLPSCEIQLASLRDRQRILKRVKQFGVGGVVAGRKGGVSAVASPVEASGSAGPMGPETGDDVVGGGTDRPEVVAQFTGENAGMALERSCGRNTRVIGRDMVDPEGVEPTRQGVIATPVCTDLKVEVVVALAVAETNRRTGPGVLEHRQEGVPRLLGGDRFPVVRVIQDKGGEGGWTQLMLRAEKGESVLCHALECPEELLFFWRLQPATFFGTHVCIDFVTGPLGLRGVFARRFLGRVAPSAYAPKHMFVLGIDPGLAICGYAIVEKIAGGERAMTAGVVRTDADQPIAERLAELHRDLSGIVEEHEPDVMAIEQVFTNRNLMTAISVGRASGVALLVAAQAGIPVFEYTPSAVKAAVAGYGKATKDQIRYVVTSRLKLKSRPEPADAADALAIALCHLQGGVSTELLQQAGTLQ